MKAWKQSMMWAADVPAAAVPVQPAAAVHRAVLKWMDSWPGSNDLSRLTAAAERITTVRSCWKPWDSVVPVPGHPFKSLPSSGVVQTPAWYGILAETVELMRR